MIFLVGDAPPHMDYTDDVKYPITCKKACEKGIIINTVQCGNAAECTKHWKEICKLAEGSYVQIAQNGGAVPVVSTPYDKELTTLNTELSRTTLVYGNRAQQKADGAKKATAEKLGAGDAAPRAAFQAKNNQVAAFDLLDNIKQGKIKLEEVKKEELPEELKKLTLKEQKEYL